jgi:hypothetical protein
MAEYCVPQRDQQLSLQGLFQAARPPAPAASPMIRDPEDKVSAVRKMYS